MSLRNTLASRFRAQLANKIIRAIAGAILTVGLARLLDPDRYGLLFLAITVIGIFKLVARLGIGRSAGRYISEYKETNPAQVPHIVRVSLLINLGMILIAALALLGSYRYIADVLDEPGLLPLLLLGVPFVVLATTITFLEKVLQGFEAIKFVAFLQVLDRISRMILALGLVVAGLGAIGALWGYLVSALLTSIVGFVYLFRRVRSYYDTTTAIEPGLRRRIVEYAVPITATNTSKILDHQVDTLLVGYFLSPVAVSYYVISEQVVKFMQTPLTALAFTLSPAFGAQKAAGNIDRVSRIYEEAVINALLLYIPAGAGIVLVAGPTIRLIFGPDYTGAIPVLQILGLYLILMAVTQISDNGLDYLGRARERAIAKGITAVLNVALNIVLIPTIGVVGAAISTVITFGLYTIANVYIAAQEFDLRVMFILKKAGLISVITGIMSAVVFSLLGHVSGLITLGLVVGIGILVWAALSVATGLLNIRKLVSIMT